MKSCFYGKIMEKIEPSARWGNFGQGCGEKKGGRKIFVLFSSSPQPFQIH